MINVTFNNNVERKRDIMSPDTTIREAIDKLGVTVTGKLMLNSRTLAEDELDKPLSAFNVSEARIFDYQKETDGIR